MSLDTVKEAAKALLYTDLHETPFSPIIVQHPFASSGFIAIRENEETCMLNILESLENLDRWHKFICTLIDKASCFSDIFYLINQPYRLFFMSTVMKIIEKQEFSHYLIRAYTDDEYPSSNIDRRSLLKMFRYADRDALMDSEELEMLEKLPEIVRIYRGVQSHNKKYARAMSWTLSAKTARWFADRYKQKGVVYSADIPREYILALCDGRDESEIIVDPKHLINIKIEEV